MADEIPDAIVAKNLATEAIIKTHPDASIGQLVSYKRANGLYIVTGQVRDTTKIYYYQLNVAVRTQKVEVMTRTEHTPSPDDQIFGA